METIKKLSNNGFLTENGWKTCDKYKVLTKQLFLTLREGDVIDNIKTNSKGYIVDFTVLRDKDGGVKHLSLSPDNSSIPPSNSIPYEGPGLQKNDSHRGPPTISAIQDRIIFGQCVNIAFNSFGDANLSFKTTEGNYFHVECAFDLAEIIYAEYIKRCSK